MDTPQASTSVQISPQPAVVSPAKPPNRRWVLWSAIGLTFLIFGIALGIFSAKFLNQSQGQPQQNQPVSVPTPLPAEASAQEGDPTANWKTYVDDKYGYSLKYPDNWEVRIVNKGDGGIILSLRFITIAPPNSDPYFGVNVDVDENPKRESVSLEWYSENRLKNYPAGTKIEDLGLYETVFDELKALKDKDGNIIVNKGKYIYTISWGVQLLKDSDEIQTTFDQILSTFKFLDQD